MREVSEQHLRRNIFDLSDAELLDALGPSWAAMSEAEHAAYPAKPAVRMHGPPTEILRPQRSRAARGFLALRKSA
jgi:hypothetical protein